MARARRPASRGRLYPPAPPLERRRRLRRTFDLHVPVERRRLRGEANRELRGAIVERFIERHLEGGRGRILEIGPGTGRFTSTLLSTGRPTVLLDFSRVMLRTTRRELRRPTGRQRPPAYVQAVAEGLHAFRDRSFDAVVAIGMFGFFGRDTDEFIAGVARSLRPGGDLLLEAVTPSGVLAEVFPFRPESSAKILRDPARHHLERIFTEGRQPYDPAHLAPWEFGFWRPLEITAELERQGFEVTDRMSVAPITGNQRLLVRQFRRDPKVWASLLEIEERCGRLPECQGVGASMLLRARRTAGTRAAVSRSSVTLARGR